LHLFDARAPSNAIFNIRREGATVREPAVYIVASRRNGTLYVGVTSDLPRRIYEHREDLIPGFSLRDGCKTLVWYEYYEDMPSAIAREKQIKAGLGERSSH
jgi:predicted GIY-YIG superfamily endonuclease